MSLIEDARRLTRPFYSDCHYCGSINPGHFEGCPMNALPKIVAALEAAEAVAVMFPSNLIDHHNCDGIEWCSMNQEEHHLYYCDGCDEAVPCDCDTHQDGQRWAHLRAWARLAHDEGCPLGVFEAALKGGA